MDHLFVTAALKPRVVRAEIDREARKGKPPPSDPAPVVVDIDEPGISMRGGVSAEERIAKRAQALRCAVCDEERHCLRPTFFRRALNGGLAVGGAGVDIGAGL